MAACSLFEEDVVCHVTPDNAFIYGLVMETSETVSSDEDEPPEDTCNTGCVRIAWHPRGKESYNTPENKVLLADRSLMVADVVRRFVQGQQTQCGTVQDLQVTCHLQVIGTDKYIYNVDSKLLSPCVHMQRYENGYVTMDNWLGRVEEVEEVIVFVLPDGARCELREMNATCLEDISEKRPENVTFSEEFYYPGQQLKGDVSVLTHATWLTSTLLYNAKNSNGNMRDTFYAVVEAVKISHFEVYWICSGYSKASVSGSNQTCMPPSTVEGEDLNRLQLVDCFEHCAVKLGDKMYYTIREEDVVETEQPKRIFVPHCAQQLLPQQLAEVTHRTEDLYLQRFNELNKPPRHKNHKRGAASASSSNATTTTTVTPSASATSLPDGAVGESCTTKDAQDAGKNRDAGKDKDTGKDRDPGREKDENAEQDLTASSVQTAAAVGGKGGGDLEVDMDIDMDADDEYEDIDDKKEEEESDDDEGSLSSSASGPKRRRRDRGIGVSIKSLRRASRQARRTRPTVEIWVKPGGRVATEVCYTFTQATVLWQDGTVEKDIPSVELYPMHHLDELEYFPGAFIVDSKALSTSNEYGIITSCNRFERTCQVKWFQPYEVGNGTFPTEVIKESEVSVYDIQDHPDYKFRPGNSVIRVSGFEDTEKTLQAVGQVVRVDLEGTVFVGWSDGSYTSSYPQDLYIVWDMSDYGSSSSSELESTNSSGLENSSEANSSPGWETEEEEWKIDGEASGDGSHESMGEEEEADPCEERVKQFNEVDESLRGEMKKTLKRIGSFFEVICESYTGLTYQTPDGVYYMKESHAALIPCLKRILKNYNTWLKVQKDTKCTASSSSSPVMQSLMASIKYHMKREKSNKIKQHLAHVFESTNKGLLDQAKEDSKGEGTTTDASDKPVSGGSDTEEKEPPQPGSLGPSVKVKTHESGTSVDRELGSSVDASSSRACGPVENGSLSVVEGVEDKKKDLDEDISCRLAATNVGEPEGTSEGTVSNQNGLAAPDQNGLAVPDNSLAAPDQNGLAAAAASPADGQEAADDDFVLKMHAFLQMANKNLLTIEECLNDVDKMAKAMKKKAVALREGKEFVVDEELRKLWTKADDEARLSTVKEEKEGEVERVAVNGAGVGSDSLEACENASGSSINGNPSVMVNGTTSGDEEEIVDPPGVVLPQGFFMSASAPSSHGYASKTCLPSNPKKFNSTVRKELKLLRSSLPHGIIVKGFEDRMDLFSVLIDGPSDTPYEDGMFMFDVMLPHDYPSSPPLFHYLSFASDRLNPNLYVDGKVCVSLLGTWSGKGMEVWTDQSNLLQVLVSIQGLILVDEPYYNEAGYERQRGHQIALENSRMYNEMALLKLVESLTTLCDRQPEPFEEEVRERLKSRGHRMIARLRKWVSLSESTGEGQSVLTYNGGAKGAAIGGAEVEAQEESPLGDGAASGTAAAASASASESQCLSDHANETTSQQPPPPPPGHPPFPLLPMSKGFRLTLQKYLTQFETALNALQTQSQGVVSGCGEASCERLEDAPS
ncbi:hypothetical protein ACOMHN_041836 [Nucella lapillus]